MDFPSDTRVDRSPARIHFRTAWSPALSVLCWLAFAAIALKLILTNPFPMPFDELEHVSYSAFLQESGRLLPKFEAQRTLGAADLSHWDNRSNYLGHPSPFYLYVSLFLDRTRAPERAILLPRLASFGLIAAGVALALRSGWRHFRSDPLAACVFCVAMAFCPKLLAISGQVTNDALGFLGGAFAYWGVSTTSRRRAAGLFAVALGITLAVWSKPNAGLAVGIWLGWFILPGLYRRWPMALAGFGGLVVGAVPYVLILRDYGALVPVTVEQFGGVSQLDGFASYLPAFPTILGCNWSFLNDCSWPLPDGAGWLDAGLFWALIGTVAYGGILAWPHLQKTRDAIAMAALLAFAVVLPIHFWFSATRLGFSVPAASFRYYLPIWPPLAHALANGVAATGLASRRVLLATIVLAAVMFGWLPSELFAAAP